MSANLFLNVFQPWDINQIKLYIQTLSGPPSPFLEKVEVFDLSVNLTKNGDMGFGLLALGQFKDVQLKANNFPVAQFLNSNFKISSTHFSKHDILGKIKTKFQVTSADEKVIRLDGVANVDVSESNILDCVISQCDFSNFLLNYNLFAQQDDLRGFFNCPKLPCKGSEVKHRIQTSNTASFFENATSSRVFNPVFLAFLYRSLLMGEKIGQGHSLQF